MAKIRSDAEGLYAQIGGYKMRPGAVGGHAHARRMDDGGLRPGDTVKARHIGGSPLGVLTLPDGTKTHWHVDDESRRRNLVSPARDNVFDKEGLRVFDRNVTVRRDEVGLRVELDGTIYRPGAVEGFGEGHRMDDGRLRPQDLVPASPVPGTPLLRVCVPDGTKTFWHAEGPARVPMPADEVPGELDWETDGRTLRSPVDGLAPGRSI